MLNKEYNVQRSELQMRRLTSYSLPYMFEYYKDVCKNPLVTHYEEFSKIFQMYLNTPLMTNNNPVMMRNPVDDMFGIMPKILEHLDKKYEE